MAELERSASAGSLGHLAEKERSTTFGLLYGRLVAWRDMVDSLTKYVQAVAHMKETSAASHRRAAELLSISESAAGEFGTEGRPVKLFVQLQKLSRCMAINESNSAINIKTSVIRELTRIQHDLKERAKVLAVYAHNDSLRISKEKKVLGAAVDQLRRSIDAHCARRQDMPTPADPWIADHRVRRRIHHNIKEDALARTKMLAELRSFMILETEVVNTLRRCIDAFSDLCESDMEMSISIIREVREQAADLDGSRERDSFTTKYRDRLARRDTYDELEDMVPLIEQVDYENKGHCLCSTAKSGRLMRKRALGSWMEAYWVLTNSGWLHCFSSSDILKYPQPEKSVYVGGSDISLHSLEPDPNDFNVITHKDGRILKRRHKYRFRGVTHAEAVEWWNALRPLAHSVLDKPISIQSPTESLEDISPNSALSLGSEHTEAIHGSFEPGTFDKLAAAVVQTLDKASFDGRGTGAAADGVTGTSVAFPSPANESAGLARVTDVPGSLPGESSGVPPPEPMSPKKLEAEKLLADALTQGSIDPAQDTGRGPPAPAV